jgi:outer membrane protein TolC
MSLPAAVLALLLVAGLVGAEEVPTLTLEDCLAFAYAHNGDVRAAGTAVAIREQEVRQAGGAFLPTVALDAFATWYDSKPSQEVNVPPELGQLLHRHDPETGAPRPPPAGLLSGFTVESTPQDPHAFKLSVTQPVFTTGKLENRLQLQREGRAAASLEEARIRDETGFAVVRAFYETLTGEQVLGASEEAERLSEAVLADMRQRVARGAAAELQLLEAEAEHTRSVLPHLQARHDLDATLGLLKNRLGWDPARPIAVRGELAYRPYPTDTRALVEQALARRADLRLLEQQRRVKERELRAAWLANTPSLYLSGNYEFFQTQRLDLPENVLYGGVVLSWPIFDGGAQYPRFRQAALGLEELDIRRATLKATVAIEVERAVSDLRLAEQSYLVEERLLATARGTLRATEGGLAAGKSTAPAVARERIVLLNVTARRAELLRDHVLAKARLDQLVGARPGPL